MLVHGVRQKAELAYRDYIENELPKDEFLSEIIEGRLLYYPPLLGKLSLILEGSQRL